jgi:hypothetical protein
VKIGLFSRGGRTWAKVDALDHDFQTEQILTPFGILLPRWGNLFLYFAQSRLTSDFIVDMVEMWWQSVKPQFPQIRKLVINQDNGPENSSRRTQYVKRIADFSKKHSLHVRLVCYPPYHSKYNPIERCWGALEQHWNGAVLESIPTALRFARTMTWKGKPPFVELITQAYPRGVKLTKEEMAQLESQIERLPALDKWFVSFGAASSPNVG